MSAELSYGAVPAPPGLTANFVNPPDHTKQLLVQHIVCLTLATLAVGVRLFTRVQVTRNLGLDDYTALFAWALTASFSGIILAANQYGFGRHLWDVPAIWLLPMLKLGYVAEILYLPIALSIKTAFLLFFGRIFAVNNNTKVKWLVNGAIAANAIFYISFIFDTIFFCTPVDKAWNPEIPGHCGSEIIAPYVSGVWAFLSDIYILILPLYCIWNLQAKKHQKWRLTLIFGVGIFACAASVIRFAYTVTLVDSLDISWSLAILSLWSVFEVYIGLICCCLPAFVPFFEHAFPNGLSLGSYFSRFSYNRSYKPGSYKSGSTANSKSSAAPSHGKIMVENDYDVVTGDYSQLEEGNRNTAYREISDHTRLSKSRELDYTHEVHHFPRTATRGKTADGGIPMSSLK